MMTIQNYSASVQDEQSIEMKRAGICDDDANGLRFSLASTLKALDTERDCWNCHGFGHRFKDADGTIVCPSPVADRPVTAVIRKLEFLNSRKGASDKRKPGGGKFKFVKKKGLPKAILQSLKLKLKSMTMEHVIKTVCPAARSTTMLVSWPFPRSLS